MKTEELADWYLRLNGFLTVRNFVLHPKTKGGQCTDGDVIAVRFPYGEEFGDKNVDDRLFSTLDRPLLLVAEATIGQCKVNDPWKKKESIRYVLKRFRQTQNLEEIAKEWSQTGGYTEPNFLYYFLCFGIRCNESLQDFPRVQQKTWDEVLHFFHERFSKFSVKTDHPQWDLAGIDIYENWKHHKRDYAAFAKAIKAACHLS